MSDRVQHIDVAKGISISLVAFFHTGLGHIFPAITEPVSIFRMPLFFFLSGVFFSFNSKPRDFIIKKSESLLKPYFFVLFIVLIFHILTGKENILSKLVSILYGNGSSELGIWIPLWFLTHLFAVYCFSYLICKTAQHFKLSWATQFISLIFLLFISPTFIDLFWNKDIETSPYSFLSLGLPFSSDLLLISSSYFILGHLLRKHIINFSPSKYIVIASIVLFLAIVNFTDAHINLHDRSYLNPFYATAGAIFGIYIVLTISWLLSKSERLSFTPLSLGASSLFILIFHVPINDTVATYLASIIENETIVITARLFSYLLCIFIPLGIKWIVVRNNILALGFYPIKSNKLVQKLRFNNWRVTKSM
ncbi:acyltransferase family protein [Vibrio sp. RC27]